MKLTLQEREALIALLSEVEEDSKHSRVLTRLRLRLEDLRERSARAGEVRWAAAIVAGLAAHEDTCQYSKRLFRRVAEDLDNHANVSVACEVPA